MQNNLPFPYTIKRNARSRNLRLTILRDGSVRVTIPKRASMTQAENFLRSRSKWVEEKLNHIKTLPPSPFAHFTTEYYRQHKESARAQLTERLESFATRYGFSYRSIAIRNQKTCWGSCSRNRIISLNYKIIFLPEEIQDYILVHELCHLKEMNHSPKFWALVESIIPEYTQRRNELRRIGVTYH